MLPSGTASCSGVHWGIDQVADAAGVATLAVGLTCSMASTSMAPLAGWWSGAPRTWRRAVTCCGDMAAGNLTWNWMYRLPCSMGRPCSGMPSSWMHFHESGLMISPGALVTSSTRSSRCWMVKEVPHSASARVISCSAAWPQRSG